MNAPPPDETPLPGRWKPDVLRPGITGIRGSMVTHTTTATNNIEYKINQLIEAVIHNTSLPYTRFLVGSSSPFMPLAERAWCEAMSAWSMK